jgi:hypothetical protein
MRKKEIFMQLKKIPEPFSGVRELMLEFPTTCLKAVVSGSYKQELDTIVENNFGSNAFTVAINGDESLRRGCTSLSTVRRSQCGTVILNSPLK